MRLREKSQSTKDLISLLQRSGKTWKAVARGLNRPGRISYSVSIRELDKFSSDKEIVVVPGKVLGSGEITKTLTIAALNFSSTARSKLEKSGSKIMNIQDMAKENPQGKGVRILG